MATISKTGNRFRPEFLERAFVRYYLHTDGPFGAAPLQYVDTSPRRLASALGLVDSREVAEQIFEALADRSSVVDAFTWASPKIIQQEDGPGFFRYLVLSCLIASVSTELADEGNYRDRLRHLLGFKFPVSDLSGTAKLWKRLAKWAEAARTKQLPVRKVVLPDPGSMTQIGYSLKIAFPSRRDRDRYEGIAPELTRLFDDPARIIHFFRGQIDRYPWSDGFKAAFFEFEKRFHAGDRLLLNHAFWCFVREANYPLESDSENENVSSSLRLLTDLVREPQAEAITLNQIDGDSRWEHTAGIGYVLSGGLDDVLGHLMAHHHGLDNVLSKVSKEAINGLLAFKEDGWGNWSWSPYPDSGYVRILVHDRLNGRCARYCKLRRASTQWWMSDQIGLGLYEKISEALGFRYRSSGMLKSVTIEGGVKTSGSYLGRRSVLPVLRAHAGVDVIVDPERTENGVLEVDQVQDDRIWLSSTDRLTGRWRISVCESDRAASSELSVCFLDRAVVHPSLNAPNPTSWRMDVETSASREVAVYQARSGERSDGQLSTEMNDLLEAVYAGGWAGWSEMDLLPLISRVAGTNGPSPWDLLRTLRDAGWLNAWVARGWKARRWYLSPLKLIKANDAVVLSGAASEVLRERFVGITADLGGRVDVDVRAGRWSVPILKASCVDLEQFAKTIGLELHSAIALCLEKAPRCWSKQDGNLERRELARQWDWDKGCFSYTPAGTSSSVKLELWVRRARDAPDLYRVVNRSGSEAIFVNRTSAILEAYRLAKKPLFRKAGTWLLAKTADGKLPDEVAHRLLLRHLSAPGVLNVGSGYCYAYPVDEKDLVWLSECFGPELFERERAARADIAIPFRMARGEKFFRAAINAERSN